MIAIVVFVLEKYASMIIASKLLIQASTDISVIISRVNRLLVAFFIPAEWW